MLLGIPGAPNPKMGTLGGSVLSYGSGFKFCLHTHKDYVMLGAYLTSLNLNFLSCKMGILMLSSQHGCEEPEKALEKAPSLVLGTQSTLKQWLKVHMRLCLLNRYQE